MKANTTITNPEGQPSNYMPKGAEFNGWYLFQVEEANETSETVVECAFVVQSGDLKGKKVTNNYDAAQTGRDGDAWQLTQLLELCCDTMVVSRDKWRTETELDIPTANLVGRLFWGRMEWSPRKVDGKVDKESPGYMNLKATTHVIDPRAKDWKGNDTAIIDAYIAKLTSAFASRNPEITETVVRDMMTKSKEKNPVVKTDTADAAVTPPASTPGAAAESPASTEGWGEF